MSDDNNSTTTPSPPLPDLEADDDFLSALFQAQCLDQSSPSNRKPRLTRHERKQQVREHYREHHKEVRLKRRQAKEQKKKDDRKALLDQFETPEERAEFVKRDREEKQREQRELKAFLEETQRNGKPKLVFNCSFASEMDGKELSSLATQIGFSYSFMKKDRIPFQFNITSCPPENPLIERMQRLSMQSFHINIHAAPYWEVYEPSELVILSPDASQELEEVEENKVYVIGGLVDRQLKLNQTQGQARNVFDEETVQIRKLPFKKYCSESKMSSVLNIDTVVGLLMDMYTLNDWEKAFEKRIPQRKRAGMGRKGMRRQQRKAAESAQGEEKTAENQQEILLTEEEAAENVLRISEVPRP